MDSGFYAAVTGLVGRTEALDLIANNLANASTTGFRASAPTFRSALAAAGANPAARLTSLNQVINDFGAIGGSWLSQTEGSIETTGNPLDVAVDGSAFFEVQTPSGSVFTRNGNFHLSSTRQLVTSSSQPVLGEQGALTLPEGPVSISKEGTVSVKGVSVGKLKLVEFPPGTSFRAAGNGYYTPEGNAQPLPGTVSSMRQGVLESSNVNPISAVVDLIEAQRSAEMLTKAMAMFHNDFDHTAAADIPRL